MHFGARPISCIAEQRKHISHKQRRISPNLAAHGHDAEAEVAGDVVHVDREAVHAMIRQHHRTARQAVAAAATTCCACARVITVFVALCAVLVKLVIRLPGALISSKCRLHSCANHSRALLLLSLALARDGSSPSAASECDSASSLCTGRITGRS